MRKIEQLFYKL